jgi:hypothetical protein
LCEIWTLSEAGKIEQQITVLSGNGLPRKELFCAAAAIGTVFCAQRGLFEQRSDCIRNRRFIAFREDNPCIPDNIWDST